jgi:lipopolysaccharide transport system permease protein
MEASAEKNAPSDALIVVEPTQGWKLPDIRELWLYRDLLYFLSRRDVVTRYKQAIVGLFWVVLQPVLLGAMFAVFLGILARFESPDIPYALLAVSGLVVWLPFAKALELCTLSTLLSESLITKIYLPRFAFPLTALANPALDLVVGVGVVIVAGVIYGYPPGIQILAVPLILLLTLVCALGFGVWFAALNVKYRDFSLLVPTLLLVGLFISPITYPFDTLTQLYPAGVQSLYELNPMVGILETFRWATLGTDFPGFRLIAVPVVMSTVLLITGSLYFERAQRTFADVI